MGEKIIEKIAELEYNEQITLLVVEGDEDLASIFLEETQAKSFTLLRHLIKVNQLKQESRDFLFEIFQQIICVKQSLIDKYLYLLNNSGPKISETIEEVIKIPEPVEVLSKPTKTPTKKTKEKVIPRRYGREAILKDIEKQGGKATNVQLTALEANDMKNMYVNLSTRLIKDMFSDKTKLSDEDYRVIRATIMILKNKINPILKKK